jgi:hypothetical protein
VQVLEDEQHRLRLGQLGQHADHGAEQLLLRQPGQVSRLADDLPVGEQARQYRPGGQCIGQRAGGRAAQGVGQRQVRDGLSELGAPARQYREAAADGLSG